MGNQGYDFGTIAVQPLAPRLWPVNSMMPAPDAHYSATEAGGFMDDSGAASAQPEIVDSTGDPRFDPELYNQLCNALA
ncbi:hypothetical protein LTR08_005394 [Meristemomyces frigidus]|nr:hypothetical protein LTR08_005394 [Meristemomyces frigidus]